MDPDEPTHFNVILVGTGLVESIVAAALAKAGYSVLQLDKNNYYGDEWASLSFEELVTWHRTRPAAAAATTVEPCLTSSSTSPRQELERLSNRFNLSLRPCLLTATGQAIDVLIRSKVSSYLSFGLLGGIGLCRSSSNETSSIRVDRVPSSKADVFNDPNLNASVTQYLSQQFKLSNDIIDSLAYALCLASSPDDPALPAMQRLRILIHSIGRFGPSPYLVGHYGGAGDLVGAFSRICAVWGGGQILGRPLSPIEFDVEPGKPVLQTQSPFVKLNDLPTKPPLPGLSQQDIGRTTTLGIPVRLDPQSNEKTMLTADCIGVSKSHLQQVLPDHVNKIQDVRQTVSVRAIIIFSQPIEFPKSVTTSLSQEESQVEPEDALLDSNLFVFGPGLFDQRLGTVTVLQVGSGTFACPVGHYVLYLQSPLQNQSLDIDVDAETLLKPYVNALVSDLTTSKSSSEASVDVIEWAAYDFERSTGDTELINKENLTSNLFVIPSVKGLGTTASLTQNLDEAVECAERMFWNIVGIKGKQEGVEFFATSQGRQDDDEDGEE
ncbi:hypothetical protein OIO90_002336 [Microbotryomycetes sp. JL221]|nr:hypothetical protein OIO90_002336 [Microbotryomycetes sp. JL221]